MLPAGPSTLALIGDETSCTMWRVWQPCLRLQQLGYRAEWGHKDDDRLVNLVHRFDAVILPRLSWALDDQRAARRWINALHNAGIAAIYEIDDDVFSPHCVSHIKATTKPDHTLAELESERLARIEALRLCDGATVSSHRLATVVREYIGEEKPVRVVPNAIDLHYWYTSLLGARRQVRGLTVGYHGGNKIAADTDPMVEAWGRIAARYPLVRFVVVGHEPPSLSDTVPDQRVTRIGWQPLERYPAAAREIDISCCPVSNRPFNRCKTPIKVWESTLAGSAVVASPCLYQQTITDGVDGLLAETADEWEDQISRLIEHPILRGDLRRRQMARVKSEHSLDRNLYRWVEAWDTIVTSWRERAGAGRSRGGLLLVGG